MSNWSRIYIRLKVNFRLQFPTIHNFSGWVCSVARDRYFQFHNCKNGQRLGGYSCPAWCTGKFNQEPHYFKKCEFSHQKKCVHFLPFEQKMCYERTRSFRVFLRIVIINKKTHPPKNGGKFELFRILVQLLIKKKICFLK